MNKPKRGFTLIELLMVIAIISLLASIILASLSDARKKALDIAGIQDLHQIKNALELFRAKYGNYPLDPLSNNETYGFSCWDSNVGFCNGLRDSSRLADLEEFMPKRPTVRQKIRAGSDVAFGYFYKVSPAGKDYLLCLLNALSNVASRPLAMTFVNVISGQYPLDPLAVCVGSSDETKDWNWNNPNWDPN